MNSKFLEQVVILCLGIAIGIGIQQWILSESIEQSQSSVTTDTIAVDLAQSRPQFLQSSLGKDKQKQPNRPENNDSLSFSEVSTGTMAEPKSADAAAVIHQPAVVAPRIEAADGQTEYQDDYLDWQAQRRKDIAKQLERFEDEQLKDFISSKIIDDNPFLSNPELRQNPIDDQLWAMQLEQDLRLILQQHVHVASGQVLLESLICKQLVCEVIAIENTPNIWSRVYLDTIGVLIQRGFNLDNMAGVNYSFHYDENSFIYHQFVFTAP